MCNNNNGPIHIVKNANDDENPVMWNEKSGSMLFVYWKATVSEMRTHFFRLSLAVKNVCVFVCTVFPLFGELNISVEKERAARERTAYIPRVWRFQLKSIYAHFVHIWLSSSRCDHFFAANYYLPVNFIVV